MQWFFLVIVVPTIFALTLTLVVLTFMGVNVFDRAENYANKIPGVSSIVSTSEEKDAQRETDQLEATIEDNNAEIDQLESEINNKDATIDDLNQTIAKLESEVESALEVEESVDSEDNRATDMAQSFQEMDEEEAAPIIENMEDTLAVSLLAQIKSEERGAILGVMDPEVAARLTSLMTDTN